MNTEDLAAFEAELTDMMDLLSAGKHLPTARQVGLWFRVLEPYPLAAVVAAMAAHQRHPDTGRTLPIPGDIVKHINDAVADDGRPGADEAWAIAVQAVDEGATVVWTAEISEAWGVARHVIALGDEVGARVAFRDAYNRVVLDARCARRPLQWQAALGLDKARQADALRRAADLGRLPRSEVDALAALPAPRAPVLLLAGGGAAEASEPSPAHRQAIEALRVAFAARDEMPSVDVLERQRTAQLQAQAADKVAAYTAGQPNTATQDAQP